MKKTVTNLAVFAALGLSTQLFGQEVAETATPNEPLTENAVGINTDEPTAALDVVGGIRGRSFRTGVLPNVKATQMVVIDRDGNLLGLPIETTTLEHLAGGSTGNNGFNVLPNYTDEERDALQDVAVGTLIYNTTSGKVEVYTGSGKDKGWNAVSGTIDGDSGSKDGDKDPGSKTDKNVADLGNVASLELKDAKGYVVSLTYMGTEVPGKIDNDKNKVQIQIPYTGGNGSAYSAVTAEATTTAESAQNSTPTTATLTIPEGHFKNGAGFIPAEVTTSDLYNVIKLAPGLEQPIATFKVKVNGQEKTITVKAIGGIPDRCFGKTTFDCVGSGSKTEKEHQFVYMPVTVKIGDYEKVWLSQNLGSDYANINKTGVFNPTKVGGNSKTDYHAYGSLFQFGREADGHELVNWASSTNGTRVKPNITWKSDSQLSYSREKDPCPTGYHTPSLEDWQDLHEALTGSRDSDYDGTIWKDRTLGLAAAGYRGNSSGSSFGSAGSSGHFWSSTPNGSSGGRNLNFSSSNSDPQNGSYRSYGFSVRCLKDNQ